MCGISGILIKDRSHGMPTAALQVRAMLSAMRHRGPDGDAEFVSEHVAMAANRLAIRGTDHPQPPLFVDESGIVVACNGEIDNHRELRQWLMSRGRFVPEGSDIAVIAPLFLEKGLDFVSDLKGVFAIALWDSRRKRLILARDRTGERHLYYATLDNGIYFASELAALRSAVPGRARVESPSLALYMRSGYCPSPWTLLGDHFKVCPGEVIVWEQGRTRYSRYWIPPFGRPSSAAPDTSSFDTTFRSAIARQTDVDVDYGVLLSGGLDSSLIAAVTRQVRSGRTLPAYCIRFDESSFDEGRHAEDVAAMLGCPITTVCMRAEQVPGTLERLIHTTGEALADPAWLPHFLITERASQDVKMLLSGEGADELFGGYPTYIGVALSDYYAKLPRVVRAAVRGWANALPVSDKKVATSFLLKKFVAAQGMDGLTRHVLWNAHLSPDWIHRLGIDYPAKPHAANQTELLDVIQRFDFEHALPDSLMAKADRGGMCHGVEIRAPFLDSDVIDFATSLPVHARVSGWNTKLFLKDYARHYLPKAVIDQRKRGLSLPLASWLRGPLKEWACFMLSSDELRDAGICRESALDLMAEHTHRQHDHARALWNLIVLSEWLKWSAQIDRVRSNAAIAEAPRHERVVVRDARQLAHG